MRTVNELWLVYGNMLEWSHYQLPPVIEVPLINEQEPCVYEDEEE